MNIPVMDRSKTKAFSNSLVGTDSFKFITKYNCPTKDIQA
jgi:hypothetical protein